MFIYFCFWFVVVPKCWLFVVSYIAFAYFEGTQWKKFRCSGVIYATDLISLIRPCVDIVEAFSRFVLASLRTKWSKDARLNTTEGIADEEKGRENIPMHLRQYLSNVFRYRRAFDRLVDVSNPRNINHAAAVLYALALYITHTQAAACTSFFIRRRSQRLSRDISPDRITAAINQYRYCSRVRQRETNGSFSNSPTRECFLTGKMISLSGAAFRPRVWSRFDIYLAVPLVDSQYRAKRVFNIKIRLQFLTRWKSFGYFNVGKLKEKKNH